MQRRRAPRRLIVFSVESSASASSAPFALHASLLFLCAGMPVRIAEVYLAKPAITPFAILGGDDHARLIPGRNALTEYSARLTFCFAWTFSSADVIPEAQASLLTLLRGHRIEGCPPLLYVLAFAVGADNLALLMLRDCQDFRELFLAGPTEIIVLGHDYLPIENSARENPS